MVVRTLIALAVVACSLAGCTQGSEVRSTGSSAKRSAIASPEASASTTVAVSPRQHPLIYLLAGRAGSDLNGIYRWRLGAGTPRLISDPARSYSFIGGSRGVVVASDQLGGQKMVLVHARSVETIKYKAQPLAGVAPSLSARGRLGYTKVRYGPHGSVAGFDIMTRTAATTGVPQARYALNKRSVEYLVGPDWSPDSKKIAFIKVWQKSGAATLIILTGRRVTKRFQLSTPYPSAPDWAPHSQWILFASVGHRSEMFSAVTGRTRLLAAGWHALCWSRTGRQVIVRQGEKLGVINISRPSRVKTVGFLDGAKVAGCYAP